MELGYGKLGNDADQWEVYHVNTGKCAAVTHDDPGGKIAALFAAAPDLLAACETIQAAADEGISLDESDWKALRAAIAKAKGRHQETP